MKNTILSSVLFLGTLLFLFISCENKETNKESPLIPLSVGNYWIYENYRYGSYPKMEIVKNEIKDFITIAGQSGYIQEGYINGDLISLVNNDEEGNYIYSFFDSNKLITKSTLFKKNPKKGEKWISKSIVFSNGDYSNYDVVDEEITCIHSDTIINTPIGDFNCIGFSYHPGGFKNGYPAHTFIHFITDGIGIVKLIHYEHEGNKKTLFKENILSDYHIK